MCLRVCVCAHLVPRVFVSVMSLSFLTAAYQLTMATNGALLAAAGLMTVVTAHCLSIIIKHILTQRGNGMASKRPSDDLRFSFLSTCESLGFKTRHFLHD